MNLSPAPDPYWTLFWTAFNAIAAGVSVLVVAVSVYLIRRQLIQQKEEIEQQIKVTKGANAQALASIALQFNLELIKDSHLARLWKTGPQQNSAFNEIEKEQYRTMLSWWLMFFENIHYQNQKGQIDPGLYDDWEKVFSSILRELEMNNYWSEKRHLYMGEFREYVDGLLTKDNKISPNVKSRRAALATTPRTCTAKFTNKWDAKISNFHLIHKSGDRVDKIKSTELSPGESQTMNIAYTTGFQSRPDLWWVRFETHYGQQSVVWSCPSNFFYDLLEEDENTEIELWVDVPEKAFYVKKAQKAVDKVSEPRRKILNQSKPATH